MSRLATTLFLAFHIGVTARSFPPVEIDPPEHYGRGIQRTMSLLAASTPERRHTVKILFYGQSITEQAWSYTLANDLRARFPDANLVITNLSIGGYGAEFLVRTAESDLFPFYPDLVIFQVYGSLSSYEDLIRQIRERTTSEIIIQTDHVTLDEELDEETDPAAAATMSAEAYKNYVFLPRLADEYGAELVDVRSGWKDYLRTHALAASTLLRDHIHLNAHGEYLMAELVKSHLRSAPQCEARWRGTVATLLVGRNVHWRNGALELDFAGNRVDVVLRGGVTGSITNYVDGLPPSAHPGSYSFTRSGPAAGTWRPALLGIGSEALPLIEDWTLTITSYDTNSRQAGFRIEGSRTGFDGAGNSATRFVSNSGRVVLEPAAWGGARSMWWTHPAEPGFQIGWGVRQHGADVIEFPPAPPSGSEAVATLIQGIPAGLHHLRIEGDESGVQAVRIYNPDGMVLPASKPCFTTAHLENGVLSLRVDAEGLFQLERKSAPDGEWEPIGSPAEGPFLQVNILGIHAFFRARKVE